MPHPSALAVAVATGAATKRGELPEPKTTPSVPPPALVRMWILKDKPFSDGVTHVILVDTDTRCMVRLSSEGLKICSETAGPSDRQIITSSRVLRALISEVLGIEEAKEKGLIVFLDGE